MLAYVFWHARADHVDDGEYVARLFDFHRALAKERPEGVVRAIVRRVRGATWIRDGGEAFEEWYLLDGSGRLDSLNMAAVRGDCSQPHDDVARLSKTGCAGLYRLRRLPPSDEPESSRSPAQETGSAKWDPAMGEVIARALAEQSAAHPSELAREETAMRHAVWFAKPPGMTYDDMYARLTPLVQESGASLWGRQMVLGPTSEFCLRSISPLSLPAPFEPASTTTLEIVEVP
jgi:hypothetical protein